MSTLVDDPYYREMPAFFGISWQELAATMNAEAWVQFETGRITEAEFLPRLFTDRRAYDHESFKDAVGNGFRYIDGVEALLADLCACGQSMHLLSNYPRWYELIEQRLQLSRYVPWSFVSCDTGLRKPDPRAFTEAIGRLGVPARRCVVVDDRERNCEIARALGCTALRFTGADQCRRDLVRQGILVR
jgi:HAD superfamily hydrolase (TIGR01509 family)